MRELAETVKVVCVLLMAAALFLFAFKFGMNSYTEYVEKNRQHEKDVRAEAMLEEKRKEEVRLEEARLRKEQAVAQLTLTQEQSKLQETRLKLVDEDLERVRKELQLKAQAEKTNRLFIELEKEAQRTVEKEAALKTTMPVRSFVLKSGTVIKSTRWMESGPEWIVKNESGDLIKIQKDQLESVR